MEIDPLDGLEFLHLSGNSLTGCIPPVLRTVAANDLGQLGLPNCTNNGRIPPPENLSVALADKTFTITWDTLAGADRYEVHQRTGDGEWETLGGVAGTTMTYSPDDGPLCETTYSFRVRAHADERAYAAAWSVLSPAEDVTTGMCNVAPEFDDASYTPYARSKRNRQGRGSASAVPDCTSC